MGHSSLALVEARVISFCHELSRARVAMRRDCRAWKACTVADVGWTSAQRLASLLSLCPFLWKRERGIVPFLYLGGRVERNLPFPRSVAYIHGLWDYRILLADPQRRTPFGPIGLRVGGRTRFSFVLP